MPVDPVSPITAKIVAWDNRKGFGFLQVGPDRLFLHRRDFAECHKRPEIGDVIRCTVGKDAKRRICAQNAVHVNDGGRITVPAMLVLACLLVLPAAALHRRGIDPVLAGAYALLISGISYIYYALDKRRAKQGRWRAPEALLHVSELLGGWPGAFIAQRRLRHKVSKTGFQIVFWLIVVAYQFAAFDSMQDWKFVKTMIGKR